MGKDNVVHVVDDDPLIRDSLVAVLEAEGFIVESHASACAFLRDVTNLDIGCVVTDVDMPGLTGLELIERLSMKGVDCPVIVMTGGGNAKVAAAAAALGATDFLQKPFAASALVASISNALAGSCVESRRAGQRSPTAWRR